MNRQLTVSVISALVIGFMAGSVMATKSAALANEDDNPYAPLDTFAQVLATIHDEYVDTMTTGDIVRFALNGLATSLDPHTQWISPAEMRQIMKEWRYEGIGVEVMRNDDNTVTLSKVYVGGPAFRDGLMSGDVLVSIDGQPVDSVSDEDIATQLMGERGSMVILVVRRQQTTLTIKTVRDIVDISSVTRAVHYGPVGYVQLANFNEQSANDLITSINSLNKHSPVESLIIDLRGNGGGLLEEAVDIVDLFVDEGLIVTTFTRQEGHQTYHGTRNTPYTSLPLTILVDGQTASAAEVMAGAIQGLGRGQLIGERTFGKQSIQTLFEFPGEGALKLSVGRFHTTSANGDDNPDNLLPDIISVPIDGQDAALTAALTDD